METQPRFRNILVPTDLSEGATRALRLAVDVARGSKGSLTLLHVGLSAGVAIDGPWDTFVPPGLFERHEELARAQKHAAEKLAREEIPDDVPWRVVTREGFPPEEILLETKEGAYDLVVMGTHGRSGIDRVLLGSVTERVLHGAPIPVLVTKW